MKFLIFMLKTSIVGTHNQCFGSKIRKKRVYPGKLQFCYIKVGFKWVFDTRTYFPDVMKKKRTNRAT